MVAPSDWPESDYERARCPCSASCLAPLRALAERFGTRFSAAAAVRDHHGRDESPYAPMPPDAVVFVESTEEVAAVVQLAAALRVPVIPYGVGTSIEGHLLALHGGISIDLGRMNSVLAINAEDLTVTAQAGITRKQLNAAIKDTGRSSDRPGRRRDDWRHGRHACLRNQRRALRHDARENVLALTVVTAEGKVIRTSRRAKKSSAGYDLTRIFVGSEGTLGIITEVTLKLIRSRRQSRRRPLVPQRGRCRADDDSDDPAWRTGGALRASRCADGQGGQSARQARPAGDADAAVRVPQDRRPA